MRKAIVVAGLLWPIVGHAQALGSAFTYQGQLDVAGQPATGLYDLQACLFESQNAAAAIACAPDVEDVPVAAGLFTIALDFGTAPFVGQARWLELRVRPGATTGAYATLAPRQPLRATPARTASGTARSNCRGASVV